MIKTLQEFLDPKHLVQNTYLFSILSIFLAMYGPRLQPKLPTSVRTVFNNDLFRAVVIFLIVYLANARINKWEPGTWLKIAPRQHAAQAVYKHRV